ncbi:MAG TPA: OmpA family protein [Candidatus Cloacimonadota bacterium]|mgnify:CR=1 FL=1|nr:OmpA family protein [Candidatus Cloacimonadota bacterium]
MKNHLREFFLIAILLIMVSLSFALTTTLTIKGGASGYQGDVKKDIDINPMVGLSYEVWLKHFLSIGLQGYYTNLGAGGNDFNFKTHVPGADLLLKLRPWEIKIGDGAIDKMAPYVIAGGGMLNYFPKTNGRPSSSDPQWGGYDYILPDESAKWNTAVFPTIGGGITFMTKHNFNIDLGIQWDNTRSDYIDGASGGDKKDSFWMGYVGLAMNFKSNYNKDTDGDGIPDRIDGDKYHAEDFDGFQDKDGIPDPDNDGDGVLDVNDKAPGTDETVSKGINTKEDIDGYQDSDGVPDPDNDNDGILDVNDKAPGTDETVKKGINTKETYNGYQDTDGVPDEVPVVKKEEPKPVVKEEPKPVEKVIPLNLVTVYFATASSELSKEATDLLDSMIEGLKYNKDVKLVIEGNTDNVGALKSNMTLSAQRADAVKAYLVGKGIDAARFTTKANGPNKPADTNKTDEGKAKNRRAEFVKVK